MSELYLIQYETRAVLSRRSFLDFSTSWKILYSDNGHEGAASTLWRGYSSKGQLSRNPFECRLKGYEVSFPGSRRRDRTLKISVPNPPINPKNEGVNGRTRNTKA